MNKLRDLYKKLISGEHPDLVIWIFPIIGLLILFLLPFLLTRNGLEVFNYTKTGQIGDTIGGIAGPIIALLAALLTFLAFWVQVQANKVQTKQFEKQANDVTIERFENKFYELLRIQRENLNEIEIGEFVKGRKAFISMFYEFRFCYVHTKKFIEDYNHQELGFPVNDEEIILDIAFHIFFMGIGDNSDKLVIASLASRCEQNFIIDFIWYLERNVKDHYRSNPNTKYVVKLKDNPNELSYSSMYLPLGGHISRLGHYFRHLFQAVSFIAEQQDDKLFSEDKKCEYAKTLRAQLSDYEQLLLYYNVVSSLGKAWTEPKQNFIRRFRMIKNMPLPLADFAVVPSIKFAEDIAFWNSKNKSFFEWDER